MGESHITYRVAVIVVCAVLVSSMVVASRPGGEDSDGCEARGLLDQAEMRAVDYRWYDFFDVPYGEWWDYRVEWYGIDIPSTDSYPYLNRHFYDESNFDTFSGARLNVTARSLPEVNMNARPVFLPLLSGEDNPGGGTAVIDWYMQYLTWQEYLDRGYPVPMTSFMDGWVVSLNGTVRLDEAGAMSVMDIAGEDFDDFETWWENHSSDFEWDYVEWFMYEGNGRLDIFCMYDYNFVPFYFAIRAEKVGEEVVLTFDALAWGMEALMASWLKDAFMPTEWWFEDFSMHARIGPESADVDIDTAVAFAIRAGETKDGSEPCWAWQGMLQDHIPSSGSHPWSSFDPYSDKTRLCQSPGSPAYGNMVPYTYTPGCFNLSEGESLAFCWPSEDILFMDHVDTMVTDNVTAPAIVFYSAPLQFEMPDQMEYSLASRTVKFDGPVDFWTWSQDQEAHENLSAEWDRVGCLPYGMPYIEMTIWGPDTPPAAYLRAERDPEATTASQYILDASGSIDSEDALEALLFQWDFDGDGTWDTSCLHDPMMIHDFEAEGTFHVIVEVRDSDNMTDTSSTTVVITDIDPPETEMRFDGDEGDDGWFVSDVVANLSASDESGVEATYYRFGTSVWWKYVEEFEITTDGIQTFEFYSVDVEGNHETPIQTSLKVDMTAPVVQILTDVPEHTEGHVAISWTCSDAMSGLDTIEISLDGGPPVDSFQWFETDFSYEFQELAVGTHTVELIVHDNAGNVGTDTYTFEIVPGPGPGDVNILYYAIAVSVLAAVVAVAVVLLVRGRR